MSSRPLHKHPNTLDAHWRFRSRRPDAATLDWIRDPGSLTARLVARSQGQFRVRITRLARARPRLDECRALGLRTGEWALIREVVLEGCGRPWVVARSVIPVGTLTGPNRRLARLGTRPLGAFLFRDPGLRRDQVQVVRTPDGHWGRRSRFLLRGRPLLVAEYFLPALLQEPAS
ncbi:MAG: chorismate--pyruvate lyase family protein [Pseudomonadota bacterium]